GWLAWGLREGGGRGGVAVGGEGSAAQAVPMIVDAPPVSCLLKLSKLPKSFLIAEASSPSGWPPALGARFCQKIEWSTCPERLKASAFSRAPSRVKSFFSRFSSSFSMFSLAFFPEAPWCFWLLT